MISKVGYRWAVDNGETSGPKKNGGGRNCFQFPKFEDLPPTLGDSAFNGDRGESHLFFEGNREMSFS
jgi:hypothetical protein